MSKTRQKTFSVYNQLQINQYLFPAAFPDMSKIAYFIYNKFIVKNADLFYKIKKAFRLKVYNSELYGKPFKYIDLSSYIVMKKEILETEIYKFKTNSPKPYIIDCGANLGLSVLYFKRLYPQAQITAFEADPDIYQILSENLSSQGINDADLVNKAVWNEDTVLRFYKEGGDAGRVANETDKQDMIEVPAISLKPYLQQEVDFLKIDIEGAEYTVLKDISEDLKRVKNIFVEYHSFVGQEQPLDEILAILRNAGFRYYIETVGINSSQPFISINAGLGMDNQMNISGYRL